MAVDSINPQFPPGAMPGQASDGTARPRLFLRDDELLAGIAALFAANAVLREASDGLREAANLTPAGLNALLAISVFHEPMSMLAGRLGVSAPTLTRTLDGLVADGLVVRIRDCSDRRRMLVTLTDQGRQVLDTVTAPMRRKLADAYRRAGGEAVAGADAILSRLTPQQARNGS